MDDSSDGSGSDLAGSIAQIFSTGVTAYVDSQAIQKGYTINNPQYYQAGYPGGVGLPYGSAPAGSGLIAPPAASASSGLLLLVAIVVIAFVAMK